MKRIISVLLICVLFCGTVFASNNYSIIKMSEFAGVGEFSEGLCAVQDKNTSRWGFVDTSKKWVISPQFQSASYFKNGLCAVNTVDGESVLINHSGKIVFKRSEFKSNIDSDIFYVEKHGKYYIVFDGLSYSWVTLLDEKYVPITSNDVALRTFRTSSSASPYGSKTLFWEENQNGVYNYKGVNITEKLTSENITPSVDMPVNNKYIIGKADGKIKCFDIDGNKLAEFDNTGNALLDGELLVCNNKVYKIADGKTIFADDTINVESIETYYNKFFTVKKKNGTSALYSADGKILVDFGKWDYIYPASVSNNMVVSINNKYGIADYTGKLLLPLEYGMAGVFVSSKNPMYYSQLSNDGKYVVLTKNGIAVNVDMKTLKCHYESTGMRDGYKYHVCGKVLLDNRFNAVYTFASDTSFSSFDFLDDGRVKLSHNTTPRTYSFLILNDGGIKVELDNSRLAFDVLPIIQNGRTLVPMRAIFEALGADVEWDGKTQTVTAKNKDVTIKLQIGNNVLIKNGQKMQMDVSPMLIDGRTMVPVRAVSDSFNVSVDWDNYTRTVVLFTN